MNLNISESNLPDFLYITLDEYPTPANFESLVNEIFSLPAWKSGLNVIVHITEANKQSHSLSDVYLYERIISKHLDKLMKSHCGVVLTDTVNPEIHNIFKLIIQHKSKKRISLFSDKQEAIDWIKEISRQARD